MIKWSCYISGIMIFAHNLIETIPDELGDATSLERLRMSGNKFTDLPDSITDLIHLTDMSVADNQLRRLPAGLGIMTQLQNLIMDNNPPLFEYIPPDVLNKGVESTRNYLKALALARETLSLSLTDQEISVLSQSF